MYFIIKMNRCVILLLGFMILCKPPTRAQLTRKLTGPQRSTHSMVQVSSVFFYFVVLEALLLLLMYGDEAFCLRKPI